MANEHTNKVVLATGEILIDLSMDDVTPENVDQGIIFHSPDGSTKTGTSTKTVDASSATAAASEVLEGRTFGKGYSIQTGTMPNKGGNNVEISDVDGSPIPRGAYDGSGKAVISSAESKKLIPENIKEGVTILGVEGTYGPDDISSQSKEVTPTFEDQLIQPDPGYVYLSSVNVKGITVSRTDNDAGGVTVTIGG